jgi:hypothetical protein
MNFVTFLVLSIFARKMAKQTLVFESPKELSLKDGMPVISDRDAGEIVMRSLENIQMILVDNHSVRLFV